jgi:chromosome segregation ATPase
MQHVDAIVASVTVFLGGLVLQRATTKRAEITLADRIVEPLLKRINELERGENECRERWDETRTELHAVREELGTARDEVRSLRNRVAEINSRAMQ